MINCKKSSEMSCRYLTHDGKCFGEATTTTWISEFHSMIKITSLGVCHLRHRATKQRIVEELIERGRKFVSLIGTYCRTYKGMSYTEETSGWHGQKASQRPSKALWSIVLGSLAPSKLLGYTSCQWCSDLQTLAQPSSSASLVVVGFLLVLLCHLPAHYTQGRGGDLRQRTLIFNNQQKI
jgi:hypothetical protein